MLRVSDAFATYGYNYDNLGRQVEITKNLVGLADEVVFSQMFDANSRRFLLGAEIDSTDDFFNFYMHDNLGRTTMITQFDALFGGNEVASKRVDFDYRADGSFGAVRRYATIFSTSQLVAESDYDYDLAGRLTGIEHFKGGTTFADYGYAYDPANRITEFTNSIHSNEDATYNYDSTGQLTGADYDSLTDESYTYDDNGNRIDVDNDAGSVTYGTGDNNQLTSDGVYTYEYDAEGNRTKRTRIADDYYTVYEWDHRNRLVSVQEYDDQDALLKQVDYVYDAFNRWIGKTVDEDGDTDVDRSEAYVYDGNQIVLRFADDTDQPLDDSALTNRYLWGSVVDQLLADEEVTSLESAGDVLWTASDHQNTVRDWLIYDSSMDETTVADHAQYDSFGNRLNTPTVDTFFGYTGRAFDQDTDLQNNWHRWYDPNVGRWMSEDPIEFEAGDTNLNRYVNNAPTHSTDPTGLKEWRNGTLTYKATANGRVTGITLPRAGKSGLSKAEIQTLVQQAVGNWAKGNPTMVYKIDEPCPEGTKGGKGKSEEWTKKNQAASVPIFLELEKPLIGKWKVVIRSEPEDQANTGKATLIGTFDISFKGKVGPCC